MVRELSLEAEEWYVLRNWLRSEENRLMYAVRSRSKQWKFVFELRQSIAEQVGTTAETTGSVRAVCLSDAQAAYLDGFLRRRARRLLVLPWRDRERRDVRRLRRHLREQFDGRNPGPRTDD